MKGSQKLQLTGGTTTKDRRALDFYPTPPEVTIALMDFLNISGLNIWECACGDGAMSRILERYGNSVFSSDIRDTGYGQGNIDFLNHTPDFLPDAIITNPPFDNSHLFIEKAVQSTNIVAMLVKSQYWHAKKRYELYKKYPPAFVMPLTWRPDFLFGSKSSSPTMEVLWTVWIKGQTTCQYIPLLKPNNQFNLL